MTVTASSMAVDYTRILREVARFLGYDTDSSVWTTEQTADVADIIRTGMNNYAHPPIIPAFGPRTHQWSWLRPRWQFSTANDQRRYTLPSDFENFVGPLQYDGQQYAYSPIQQVPALRLMQLANDWETSGVPTLFAIEPLAGDNTREQQWQLVLHPTPDDTYPLTGQYQIGIRVLSTSNPYPPGGPAHGEGWLAAILAAAEDKLDNEPGPRKIAFMERLMSDIAMDLQKQPRTLGYVGNGRDRLAKSRSQARDSVSLETGYTTYNSGTEV